MDRRDFIGRMAAMSAAVLPWPAAASHPVIGVIYDARYGDARDFAAALAARGAGAFEVRPDPVWLWRRTLRAHVERHVDGCLAGMTSQCDRQLLEACARELGWRTRCVATHDARNATRLIHSWTGADARLVRRALGRTNARWPASLAHAFATGSFARSPGGGAVVAVVTEIEPSADHPGTLTSWLLGPSAC